MNKIPAANLMATIAANVNNDELSDKDFRDFVKNSITLVDDEHVQEIIKVGVR